MDSREIREVPIIDAHVHVGKDWDGSEVHEGELIQVMDENHISRALVFPFNEMDSGKNFLLANRKNLGLQSRYEGRILSGFRIDPKEEFSETLDFAEKNRFPVMKLHPTAQEFKVSSPLFRNLLDDLQARRYRPVVYLHTDIIPVEGTHCDRLNCPRDVLKVARRYLDFCFVIAHCGRWCDETREGIGKVDNVFIDTSIAPLFVIKKSLSIVGAQRVVFGSDYPYSHPRIELEKIFLLNLLIVILRLFYPGISSRSSHDSSVGLFQQLVRDL